jgi:hypothetical protein
MCTIDIVWPAMPAAGSALRADFIGQPLMGIAAGGIISQKVYKDSLSVERYDEEAVQRLWIHTVSTEAWEVRLLVAQSAA